MASSSVDTSELKDIAKLGIQFTGDVQGPGGRSITTDYVDGKPVTTMSEGSRAAKARANRDNLATEAFKGARGAVGDLSYDQGVVDKTSQAYYDQAAGLLDRSFDRQTRQFDQKMANRGLPMGSEAFSTGYGDMATAQNQSYQNLANQSVLAGQQAASQDLQNQLAQISTLFGVGQGTGTVQDLAMSPTNFLPGAGSSPAFTNTSADGGDYLTAGLDLLNTGSSIGSNLGFFG